MYKRQVVPGLYAAGELTGSVGINGTHGMDGMFLGPSLLTGRVAGRTIADTQAAGAAALLVRAPPPEQSLPAAGWDASLSAEDLAGLLASEREGYWHFQVSHELVLEWQYECTLCHSAQVPFYPLNNTQSKLAQSQVCGNCHGRGLPAPLAQRLGD